MGFYVIFGGMWGAGMGGVAKLILLYASAIVGEFWFTAWPMDSADCWRPWSSC